MLAKSASEPSGDGGIVGAGEGLAECLERLGSRLGELAEEWDNLPSPSEVLSLNSYLNGRFAFLVEANISGHRYCIAAYARPANCNPPTVIGFEYGVLRQLGDVECRNEQVVLLPVAQIVEGAKQTIPAIREILMRFYPVSKKFNDLIDHTTIGYRFKNIARGGFNTFPVGAERDIARSLRSWFEKTFQPHETEVETGPKVVASVANEAGNSVGGRLSDCTVKHIASHLRIFFEGDFVGLRVDESLDLPVELLNQFVGPYDLKGRIAES